MDTLKVLFIGNSATYFHEMPKTFAKMAESMGRSVETDQLTPGGCVLSRFADPADEVGVKAREKIAAGHDIVFLQDSISCMDSPETMETSRASCRVLDGLVRESGARTFLYIRPPLGYEAHNHTQQGQIDALMELFTGLGAELNAPCARAAAAFGICLNTHPEINLFWTDNAHTSDAGAYLVACCCYIAVFGDLPEEIFEGDIPHETAMILKGIAREAMA